MRKYEDFIYTMIICLLIFIIPLIAEILRIYIWK